MARTELSIGCCLSSCSHRLFPLLSALADRSDKTEHIGYMLTSLRVPFALPFALPVPLDSVDLLVSQWLYFSHAKIVSLRRDATTLTCSAPTLC